MSLLPILSLSASLSLTGCHAPNDLSSGKDFGIEYGPEQTAGLAESDLSGREPMPQDFMDARDLQPAQPEDGIADRMAPVYGASTWENPDWRSGAAEAEPAHRSNAGPAVASEVAASARRETRPRPASGIPVLCYHQIEPNNKKYKGFNVSPERFEEQLRYLKDAGYESLSQAQLIEVLAGRATPGRNGVPERGVFLSFDDGLISHYKTAAPLLKRYGFRGTLFLYPTVLSSNKKAYMNWDQARELLRGGVFEAGSHSLYHPFLPEASDRELKRQMRISRKLLEEKLQTQIRVFAYPFGVYDRRVIAAADAAGYELAFTIHTGVVRENENRLTLNRYMVTRGDDLRRFQSYLRLEAPKDISLQPADGSHVRPGESFTLHLPNVRGDSVRVRLGGRDLKLEQTGSVFSGRLPEYKSSRGYLPLEVRAKDRDGRSLFRRFLYLDAAKF